LWQNNLRNMITCMESERKRFCLQEKLEMKVKEEKGIELP